MTNNATIVGAGIFGCACARILAESGFKVNVVESRPCIGGNCTSYMDGEIEVHQYGSHIFHTDREDVWSFLNRFTSFNGYTHRILAEHDGERFFLPFNLSLVNQFFRKNMSPSDAIRFINSLKIPVDNPKNLEQQAMSLIGRDLYEAFVKNYTAKQWHAQPKDLDPSIIRRIPVRATYDTSYFNDIHQGIPADGYQKMFEKMLDHNNIVVSLGIEYSYNDVIRDVKGGIVIYTGALDELFGYCFGVLSWRSLEFRTETVGVSDYQGTATVNYVDAEPAYTRIHEFKYYHPERCYSQNRTVIQYEYPADWRAGSEKYYPVNNVDTEEIYLKYLEKAKSIQGFYVGGRLGLYRYLDMDDAVAEAFKLCERIKISVNSMSH